MVESAKQSPGAFLSWKPICYTSKVRKVLSSERVMNYELSRYDFLSDSVNSSGLAFAFFGSLHNWTHIRAGNVSFGGPKDKQYYGVTQYTAWLAVSVFFSSNFYQYFCICFCLRISCFCTGSFLLFSKCCPLILIGLF